MARIIQSVRGIRPRPLEFKHRGIQCKSVRINKSSCGRRNGNKGDVCNSGTVSKKPPSRTGLTLVQSIMESFEIVDRECSALGGLFQLVVNDMKTGVPYYEEFVNRAAKLHSQLKNTILSLGTFLDAFQKIADAATNARGGTREIGACLTRIVIRHKAMESRLKTLCSALLDCMILPLQDKIEDWKKTGSLLDKEHAKDYKKNRSEYKKKSENYARLQKKHKKNPSKGSSNGNCNNNSNSILESSLMEVNKQMKVLEDTEKNAVRKVLTEERLRYCTLVACLKPLIDEEVFMVSEFQQLEEISKKVSNATEDPFKLPPASEQVITDIISTKKWRAKSSMCSISSAGSSAGSPSHQSVSANSKNNIRHRSLSQHNPSSTLGPMRLSSISSQDSGFTSQDTLFIRPHSPTSRSKLAGNVQDNEGVGLRGVTGAPPPGDRPHTISSAYEKGHQRPQLQPYTFAPPPSMNEILEESHTENNNASNYATPIQNRQQKPQGGGGGFGGTLLRRFGSQEKPPVPQRCVSLERPNIPQNKSVVPVFHANKDDMVLPQPVYMNMNDLANMRKKNEMKQQQQEEFDLKTPTTEELSGVPDIKNGDGGSSSNSDSSSGYGSQSTVRLEDQTQQDGSTFLQNGATLRRSNSHHHPSRPPPPARMPTTPPPAPLSHIEESPPNYGGSNSTTPRGSMENLPPPPPHLLHSDEEDDDIANSKRSPPEEVISQRSLSVADSIRALQNINHKPASPKNLRRAHSVASGECGGRSPGLQSQNKRALEQVLNTKLNKHQHPTEQQIYAPAPLQQQQQQQMGVHGMPDGDHYGFGIQFYQHQNQFYHHHQQQVKDVGQQPGYDQIMNDIDEKMRSRPQPPPPCQRCDHLFNKPSWVDQPLSHRAHMRNKRRIEYADGSSHALSPMSRIVGLI
ncbi:MTSS1 [Lepeophtheirus salmonis]|uniref:MTSS1 n=1 Tax=Lepeophtheirus salmonis TaxID=72036 RepID=A0A7R8H5K1_LEPSM|nr:MTSS1 [Lepeophtheirus salmonis]CAF2882006.1 MTSS1 [Lepeophtheirus salmonis]